MFFSRRSSIGDMPSDTKSNTLQPLGLNMHANRGSMVLNDPKKMLEIPDSSRNGGPLGGDYASGRLKKNSLLRGSV